MHMNREAIMKWIGALAASLAVLTAACSNDQETQVDPETQFDADPATEQSKAVSQIEPGVQVVQATLSEWKIALSQDSIPAGPVAFQVSNSGSVEHAFEVEGTQDNGEWETDALAPGGSVTMSLNLEPGVYEVYCPVNANGTNHKERGMRTRLRVY